MSKAVTYKEKVQGRIFAMTKEGINPDSSVISSTILISGRVATTLIYTGATHSFMSELFMRSLDIILSVLSLHLSIMLPSGDEICPTSIIYACPVHIDERIVYANLIVIPMVAFDVFLGMDWLTTYHAIDRVAKTVRFSDDSNKEGMLASAGIFWSFL